MVMTGTPRSLTVLGSTGSVGRSTLDLGMRAPERFDVEALTAGRNVARLAEQAKAGNAKLAGIAEESGHAEPKERVGGANNEVAAGNEGVKAAGGRPAP